VSQPRSEPSISRIEVESITERAAYLVGEHVVIIVMLTISLLYDARYVAVKALRKSDALSFSLFPVGPTWSIWHP
jgi:phosphoenolpyruvate synthase/pyruvate phosphate dikinase